MRNTYSGPDAVTGTISGFRDALRDVSQGAKVLEPDEQADFLEKFRAHFGEEFFAIAGDPEKEANKILKRGRIRKNYEFRLIKDYADSLDDDAEGMALKSTIWAMLEEYEFSTGE
jgi:hypothetical protein